MAIKIGSNFTFQGKQPNFERDRFATKAAMKAFPETSIDDGHLSYCSEDGNTYQFKSSNAVDGTTGRWRIFKADVDLSAYATKDSVDEKLSNKVNLKGEGIKTPSRDTIVKIAVFDFGYIRYRTSYAYLTIMCRNVVTKVVIAINNDSLPGNLTVFEKRVVAKMAHYTTQENVYYYHETDTGKVTLYYSTVGDDVIRVKLTDKGVNYDFDYNPTMEIVDALPEGAIKVKDVNYGNKNLFYATPKDVAGDPNFRAIDITDLPDLSSKYATKEKAFTKDTVSTEPGQFVAGPINTRGNISLRKIDISDIPDLRSKYQKLDGNGYQEKAKVAGLIVKHGNTGDTGSGYLIAEVDQSVGGQMGPDWYYATDGTLQDIKTKIPKVVLDDAVSTTSDNGVKNSVITKYVDGKVTTINDSIADVRTSLESTQTDFVDLRNKVNAMPKTVFITQDAYNALTTKDPNTIYYING